MQLGDMLKKLRKEAGLSQQKLADMMGLTQSSVANYERNFRHPNLEVLTQFSELFEVSVDCLLGKSIDESSMGNDQGNAIQRSDDFLTLLLKGDEKNAWTFLESYHNQFGFEEVLFRLFRYSLTKLGWLWEVGEITISQEHEITAVMERLLDQLDPHEVSSGKVIMMMTAPKERHTFGLKMLSRALNRQGYRTLYIGECVPLADFRMTLNRIKPDCLIISITMPHKQGELTPYFEAAGPIPKYLVGMGVEGYENRSVKMFRDYEQCLAVLK